jgi:hypothetical protein
MSKTNNYLVTFSEVSTMGFTAKATWPVGSGSYAMNRGEVDTYWYVRQDASPYSGYTNKRYPRYQDLEATTTVASQCTYDGFTIVCDAVTTTSTTTTTTATPTYITYPADKYVCAGASCGAFDSSVYIAFTSGFTPIVGKWYSALDPDGYAYELTSITPAVGAGLIMYEGSFNTCGLACMI